MSLMRCQAKSTKSHLSGCSKTPVSCSKSLPLGCGLWRQTLWDVRSCETNWWPGRPTWPVKLTWQNWQNWRHALLIASECDPGGYVMLCFRHGRLFYVKCPFCDIFLINNSAMVLLWINMKPYSELLQRLHVCKSSQSDGWQGQKHQVCIVPLVCVDDSWSTSKPLQIYRTAKKTEIWSLRKTSEVLVGVTWQRKVER